MPNNIVFNNVASQLKTQLYGYDGSSVVPIMTDASGNIKIVGVSGDTIPVSIADPVTVTIPDTVAVTAADLDIRDLSGTRDSVIKAGSYFSESIITLPNITSTGIALTIDNSQQDIYSFYVKNTGAAAVSVKLQISPTDVDDYFTDDPSNETLIAADNMDVLVAQKFLRYTRVYYNASDTTSIEVYYNAHA
ncbi:MAG: hypothetical protein HPY66_1044 [Firmicutes bacterium]|nr:hypothetical protein [Bacillota bacterium]MDI6706430.1 DUF6385 domain-containing protein [Bacillota bacterium]